MNSLSHMSSNLNDLSLGELQEIALRQQQQIEINQQLLLAKEKRLKLLKQEETKNQQLNLLTNHNQTVLQSNSKLDPNSLSKLENLKQNVLSQELKIFKLKQLRNQILEYKLSNSNMYSELDLIKTLFEQKERELYGAVNKVGELSKQIEQLRRLKQSNKGNPQLPLSPLNSNLNELERLKQELQIRNKLNEQQAKKIVQQHELFNKKQLEVIQLDKRIEDLKQRINLKRKEKELQQQQRKENEIKQSQSPSKQTAKFATKQEIANTYMNKFSSEAYQKYQAQSIKIIQQQQQQQHQSQPFVQINEDEPHTESSLSQGSLPSSSSSLISLSPMSNPTQIQNAQTHVPIEQESDLPSHLKLEFDKIKYLPDVVKTIKKRHSISEIESSNTIAPQVYQKILEKHQENTKLSKIAETMDDGAIKPIQIQSETKQPEPPVKLITFMPDLKQKQEPKLEPITTSSTEPQLKSTKSIIKLNNQQSEEQNASSNHQSRRVNFDPHALLLDAAVEGELDLVKKCAAQIKDISEPNDEGITALHNSVCAGHFEIVKFLVEYGCDINYADNDGWTPLHCAASCNNLQMIKFLIENGASVFATTISDNETAIKKCEEDEDGYQACYDYLMSVQHNLGNSEFNTATVHALYDYEAEQEDELSFNCHDKLVVLDKHENEEQGDANDGWWTCKLVQDNQQGLVPRNYLGLYPRVQGNLSKEHEESTVC